MPEPEKPPRLRKRKFGDTAAVLPSGLTTDWLNELVGHEMVLQARGTDALMQSLTEHPVRNYAVYHAEEKQLRFSGKPPPALAELDGLVDEMNVLPTVSREKNLDPDMIAKMFLDIHKRMTDVIYGR